MDAVFLLPARVASSELYTQQQRAWKVAIRFWLTLPYLPRWVGGRGGSECFCLLVYAGGADIEPGTLYSLLA
jgi:hypothetical protein